MCCVHLYVNDVYNCAVFCVYAICVLKVCYIICLYSVCMLYVCLRYANNAVYAFN
jgi:hypothetical protein